MDLLCLEFKTHNFLRDSLHNLQFDSLPSYSWRERVSRWNFLSKNKNGKAFGVLHIFQKDLLYPRDFIGLKIHVRDRKRNTWGLRCSKGGKITSLNLMKTSPDYLNIRLTQMSHFIFFKLLVQVVIQPSHYLFSNKNLLWQQSQNIYLFRTELFWCCFFNNQLPFQKRNGENFPKVIFKKENTNRGNY